MTQRDKVRNLFLFRPNKWIPLPEILDLNVAQYNARIHELRQEGLLIVNYTKIVNVNGQIQKHSWFKYIPAKEKTKQLTFIGV